jgi:hypothetical protein
MLFIIQVAAVSCADTQVPETTVANQSLLKVGFCKAIQVDVLVIALSTAQVEARSSSQKTSSSLLRENQEVLVGKKSEALIQLKGSV